MVKCRYQEYELALLSATIWHCVAMPIMSINGLQQFMLEKRPCNGTDLIRHQPMPASTLLYLCISECGLIEH